MAYSFRKLRDAYAGPAIRIRRASDNVEMDFGFLGADFNAPAAPSFIGGSSGFIAKWYDQSGNALDVIQATSSTQPSYSAAGLNGFASALFDRPDEQLSKSSFDIVPYISSQGTAFTVSLQDGTSTTGTLWGWMG